MKKTVLVVDDEAALRNAFETYFSKCGYEVLTAENAGGALEQLRRHSVPLCFLDLELPGEHNGLELCREIRQRNPMTTCVAVTGRRSLFEIAECRAAGFEDYFTKPTRLEHLQALAERVFERVDRWKRT